MSRFERISVVGLGYIGLPTSAVFADNGVEVIGVDVNAVAVEGINAGRPHFVEPELDVLLRKVVERGKLRATLIPEPADAFIVAVPTPFKDGYVPDLSYIESAADAIGPVLANGATVEFYSPVKVDAKATDPRLAATLTQLREGRLDEAQRTAASLLEDTPASSLGDNLLGGVLAAQGDLAAARRHFDNALRKNYDSLPVRLNIAGLNLAEGKSADAARHYAAIVGLSPNNTEAMTALADLALRRQQPAEAESWLAYGAIADLTDVAPRIALVDLYLGRKDQAKAKAAALELQKIAPANPDALDAVGRVQLAGGDMAAAMATYRALVAAAPTKPGAHVGLARALTLAGDAKAAMTVLRAGLADLPDAVALAAELSKLLQRAGESEEALKVARDWQSRHPARAEGDILLADILEQQGKFHEAAGGFAAALQKQPATGTAIALARTRMAAGDGDAAAAALRQWIQQHPQDKAAQDALKALLAAKGP